MIAAMVSDNMVNMFQRHDEVHYLPHAAYRTI